MVSPLHLPLQWEWVKTGRVRLLPRNSKHFQINHNYSDKYLQAWFFATTRNIHMCERPCFQLPLFINQQSGLVKYQQRTIRWFKNEIANVELYPHVFQQQEPRMLHMVFGQWRGKARHWHISNRAVRTSQLAIANVQRSPKRMPKIKGIGCMRRENTAREKRATFSSPLQCFEVLWWKEPVVTLSLSATRLLHEMSSSSPFPTDPFTVLVPQNKPLRCSHLSIDGFCCEKVGRAIQLSSLTIGRKRAFLIEFVKRNGRKIWLLLSLSFSGYSPVRKRKEEIPRLSWPSQVTATMLNRSLNLWYWR